MISYSSFEKADGNYYAIYTNKLNRIIYEEKICMCEEEKNGGRMKRIKHKPEKVATITHRPHKKNVTTACDKTIVFDHITASRK